MPGPGQHAFTTAQPVEHARRELGVVEQVLCDQDDRAGRREWDRLKRREQRGSVQPAELT
jgi:hypothetical protein